MTTNHEREVLMADVMIDIEEAVRELRPRMAEDSPPWLRNLWRSLRGIQGRMERHSAKLFNEIADKAD